MRKCQTNARHDLTAQSPQAQGQTGGQCERCRRVGHKKGFCENHSYNILLSLGRACPL
ncbi:hypothetical protein [Moraxella lacunata]|uniref:hypothetical protein n=1 Tax=Moraxella lacunata TaxID=477 RepID=UPI003EE0FA44